MEQSNHKEPDLSQFFNLPLDFLVVTSRDGQFKKVNDAFLSALGYQPKELLSQSFWKFVHPDDQAPSLGEIKRLGNGKPVDFFENRFLCKDGRYKRLQWKATFFEDSIFASARDITDLRLTQESLWKSERKLRNLVDHSPFCIHEIDLTGKVQSMNPAGVAMLGKKQEEQVTGREYVGFVRAADQKRVKKLMSNAFNGKSEYFNFESGKGNGRKVFSSCFIPIREDSNKVVRLMGLTQDITSESTAKQALLESEEKYRMLVEKAPVGIGLADMEGNLITYNEAILRPGKYTEDDAKSIVNLNKLFADQRDREKVIGKFRKKGFVEQTEVRFKKKDGSDYHASLSLRPVRVSGKPCLMALVEDVSGRKVAEDKLTQNQRLNNSILETSIDGFILHDEQGKILDVNQSYLDLTGYTREELLGTRMHQRHIGYSRKQVRELIAGIVGKGYGRLESLHQKKDGGTIPLEVSKSAIQMNGKSLVAGFFRDITHRKSIESEMRRSKGLLETAQSIANLGSFELDLERNHLEWSREMYRIYELDPEEGITQERALGVLHPDDRREAEEYVESLIKRRKSPRTLYYRIDTPTGKTKILAGKSQVIFDEDSKPRKLIGTVQDITEQKNAELAMKESEEKLGLIFNNTRELLNLIAYDPTGHHRFVAVNKAFLDTVQLTEQEVLGQKILKFIAEEDRDFILDQYKQVAKSKLPLRGTRVFETPDGEMFFEADVIPIISDQGDVTHLLTVARDITEQKRAERALAESEGKYRALFEKAPIGIGLSDLEGNLIDFNQAILKPGGYTDKDLWKIKKVTDLYVDSNERKKLLQELKRKGFVEQQQVSFKRKDGSTYFGLMNLAPIQIEGRQCNMAMIEDITESKTAQDQLKVSEERLKTIVENVHEAIMLYNPRNQKFIGVNQRAVQLFGYSEDELMKLNPVALSPREQEDGSRSKVLVQEKIEQALTGESPVFEWLHRNAKGMVFECEVRLTKVPYLEHEVIMASVFDITARKSQEREREDLISELDRFVYSASHDLSAPLKSLRGLINLAKMDPSEEKKLDYLDKMDSSISRLEGFIDDIINYSRNSRLEIIEEKINPEQMVGEILENLKFMESFGRITFKVKSSTGGEIRTDPFRLKIILNNLFSNAIKFQRPSAEPAPFVKINIKPRKNGFTIDVRDNGLGIPLRYQKQIFDMFFRANTNTSGSGLGLYIAQETAKRINGKLTFQSERGEGSLFRLVVSKATPHSATRGI